jgi:hypothetical protein
MKFHMVEMGFDWPYSGVGKLALMFILSALIVFIYHVIALQIRYRRLWRFSRLLGQPLLTQLETGKWEPAELSSWREIKDPKFMTMVEALRREFPGRGPMSVTAAINQGLDLLAGPFKRMTYHLQVLGWSACLISWLGVLSEIRHVFLSLIPDTKFTVIAQFVADAIPLQLYGLAVGLGCLWVSSFARSRLMFLHQDLSNRILTASSKKAG